MSTQDDAHLSTALYDLSWAGAGEIGPLMDRLYPAESDILPPFVESWPSAKLEWEGVTGRILKGEHGSVMFMAADRDVAVPSHHHGAQWGIVLQGRMRLTIGGYTRFYHPGEPHFIPAGVEHEAVLYAGWRGLYIFAPPAAPTPQR